MILCSNCYQGKSGGGRRWFWSMHKKDKWGRSLQENESCQQCHAERCLLTDTDEGWTEIGKGRFWSYVKLTVDQKALAKMKEREKPKPQWLLDRMKNYGKRN